MSVLTAQFDSLVPSQTPGIREFGLDISESSMLIAQNQPLQYPLRAHGNNEKERRLALPSGAAVDSELSPSSENGREQ